MWINFSGNYTPLILDVYNKTPGLRVPTGKCVIPLGIEHTRKGLYYVVRVEGCI